MIYLTIQWLGILFILIGVTAIVGFIALVVFLFKLFVPELFKEDEEDKESP